MSSILAAEAIVQKAIEYCNIPSVVGYEFPFAQYLQKEYQQLGYCTSLINNSVLIHGNDLSLPLISIHIDRHGLIKTGINEYTYAGFVVEKDWFNVDYIKHPDFLASLSKGYLGQPVTAYDYISGETIADGVIIDAKIDEEKNKLIFSVAGTENVPIGTPLSYSVKYKATDTTFSAQIDNLISVAIIHQLCLHGYQGSILFTPEEEVGQSWSYLLHHLEEGKVNTKDILILDTCPLESIDSLAPGTVVLRNKDALASFSGEMMSKLEQTLINLHVPYIKIDEIIDQENRMHEQFKQPLKGLGITELGQLISHTQGKYSGATLQLPTIGYHTNQETTTIASISNIFTTLTSYLGLSE